MANLMARNVALKPAKKPRKSHVIKNAARGRECEVRLPSICNKDPDTTVLAHYRMAGTCGTGIKPDDAQAAFACSACHDAIDGRALTAIDPTSLRLWHAEGVLRTQAILRKEGKLK